MLRDAAAAAAAPGVVVVVVVGFPLLTQGGGGGGEDCMLTLSLPLLLPEARTVCKGSRQSTRGRERGKSGWLPLPHAHALQACYMGSSSSRKEEEKGGKESEKGGKEEEESRMEGRSLLLFSLGD